MNAGTQARVAQLEQVFTHIGAARMQGVPVLNAALRVQAVGFEVLAEEDAPVLLGILITPWFMNLLRLPLASDSAAVAPQPGSKRGHVCGGQLFEFIAGQEEALGSFEACSLFSPMFEFADQAGAVATATEVLKLLRTPPVEPASASVGQASSPFPSPLASASKATPSQAGALAHSLARADTPQAPSRRGFLFGRSGSGAAP